MQLGQFWALVPQHIRMEKFPKWSDKIVIETWPRGVDRLWAFRDYYLRDGDHAIIGRVTSSWMIIDQKTRRPQKPGIVYDALSFTRPEKAFGFDAPRLEWNGSCITMEERRVCYSDLNQNSHVNNSRIVEWIFDAVRNSSDVFPCVEFSINFISEIKQEDVVLLLGSGSQFPGYVKGVRKDQDTLLFIAKLS